MIEETKTLNAPASSSTSSDEGATVSISPKSEDIETSELAGESPIEEAKRILWENKKMLEQISAERRRIEKATSEMLINGRSYAGQTPARPETADEKWEREAKIRYAGTGMCPV